MAKRPAFLTPIGTLGWCSIQEPDTTYSDKEDPNDLGVYKAMLRLPKDAPSTKKFLGELEAIFTQFLDEQKAEKGKSIKVHEDGMPWADELDRDTEEPTGNVLVRAKLKARVVMKRTGKFFDQRPKVFDSQKKLVVEVPQIGPGSKVRIGGQVNCWFATKAGMTLWLEAVQILDLVERGGAQSADDFGFNDEDGYSAQPSYLDESSDAGSEAKTGNF